MRPLASFLLVCALGCSSQPQRPATSAPAVIAPRSAAVDASAGDVPAPGPSAPLVVTVVIDQFAAWVADERLPLLPATGGFARLRREGVWYRQLRYSHAATDTAPGHSSLYTGLPPRETGILANEVPDARGGRGSILRDEASRVVTAEGATDDLGSSIGRLRVPTLADALRERHPDAVIVSVSLKDRGAIFGGGRRPTATLWFDPSRDRFVTSTAFSPTLPPWVETHGATPAIVALRSAPWTLTDEAWVRSHSATPDAQPGEGDLDGWGTVFPHDFTHARRAPGAFRASPLGDTAVLNLAEDAVVHARVRGAPMLLAVSLSSNDYVGHLFGPDSWEAWDQLHRLDASLGRFMSRLDALAGPDGWSMVLAADHGITQLPEVASVPAARPWCARDGGSDPYERPCGPLGRLDPDAIARELQAAAVRSLGAGQWVLGVADPYVYVTPEARNLSAQRRERLQAALVRRLRQYPEVERVLEARFVHAQCPDGESVEALLCWSIPMDSGAALYVQTRAGAFFDSGYDLGRGTSHGSPYLFDRSVPMLLRRPGREVSHPVVQEPIPYTEFRRQAEILLGL